MLGKVLKYEFKNSVAVMGIFYAALVLFTIMGCFGLHGFQIDSSASTPASVWFGVLLVIYFIGMVAVNVVSFIYFCKSYSTTMYSAQGYLTFTLPVNPTTIYSAKVICAFIWMMVTFILSGVSLFLFVWSGLTPEAIMEFKTLDWAALSQEMYMESGMSLEYLIKILCISMPLSFLWYILFIFTCISAGQLVNRNRMVCSILTGVIIYTIMEAANLVIMAFTGYYDYMELVMEPTVTEAELMASMKNMLNSTIIGSVIVQILFLIALWFFCCYINKKKLNLE